MPIRRLNLDAQLEARPRRAAEARGESVPDVIRRAAAERADATLNAEPADVADVIGVVRGGGGRARRTGAAFTDALVSRPPKP